MRSIILPIIFIISNIILIFVASNFLRIKNRKYRFFLLTFLFFLSIGYMFPKINFNEIYINAIHLVLICILFIKLFRFKNDLYIKSTLFSFLYVILSAVYQINEFTFAIIDFDIIFESLLIMYLVNEIFKVLLKKNIGGDYVKKTMLNFDSNCNCHSNSII